MELKALACTALFMLIVYFFGNRLLSAGKPAVAVLRTSRPKKYATRVCDLKMQPVDGSTPVSQLF